MSTNLMHAAVLHAREELVYEEIPEPSAGPGEVKVHVRACGICGSDIPRVLENAAFFYPIVLGHEFAGDIAEVGEGVTSVQVGDTVTGAALLPCMKCEDCARGDYGLCKNYSFLGSRKNGAFSDYVVLPQENVVKYAPSIPYTTAVLFEPCTVAMHGLRKAGYTGGGATAILGGGTIGIFTAQLCRIFGASNVVVLDIDDDRLAMAARMGADAVINTTAPDFAEKALALTKGRGFDWVFEVAGQPATMQMAFSLSAPKATVCFIGFPHVPVTFEPRLWEALNLKELTLVGSRMSYTAPFPGPDWTLVAHYLETGQLKIDPAMIFRRYPMKDAAKAFDLFRRPGAVKGKIILENQ